MSYFCYGQQFPTRLAFLLLLVSEFVLFLEILFCETNARELFDQFFANLQDGEFCRTIHKMR